MRGIALCDCIPEYDQTLCAGQTGIRFPVVTVQLPVGGSGCFSDYIDVNLAFGSLGRAPCMVCEILRGVFATVHLAELRTAKTEIIENIDRKNVGFQYPLVFAHFIGRGQEQPSENEGRESDQGDILAGCFRKTVPLSDVA